MASFLDWLNPFKDMEEPTGLEGLEGLYDIDLPELRELTPEQELYLGDLTDQGDVDFDPVEFSDIESAFGGLEVDPLGREKQLGALSAFEDIEARGGMNLADMAAMNKVRSSVGTSDRGRRDAILQNMSARGMGGSGMELLAQLDSAQAATDRESQAGMDQAAMMQQRALDSIMAQGDIGRQISSDDWQRQAQKAQARDIIAQFNAKNSMAAKQANAQRAYEAGIANRDYRTGLQGRNLDTRQQIQGRNVQGRNRAQEYNRQIPQQQFGNQMDIAGGRAGARTAQSQARQSERDRENARRGAILGGAGRIGAGIATGGTSEVANPEAGMNPIPLAAGPNENQSRRRWF